MSMSIRKTFGTDAYKFTSSALMILHLKDNVPDRSILQP